MHEAQKELLLKKKLEIETQMDRLSQGTDFGDDVDDLEEETDETEELVNREGVRAAFTEELVTIQNALQRIDQGTYGVCTKCDGVIDQEVLAAEPASSLCRQCKHSL